MKTESTSFLWSCDLPDAQATEAFGASLATVCRNGDCITLSGDLGAGKTSLARGFIQYLLPGTEVTSPTFNLVQIYPYAQGQVWHADLYRLNRLQEFAELGFDDALEQGMALIEWPEIATDYLPFDRLEVTLTHHEQGRRVTCSSTDENWQARFVHIL